MPDTGRLAMCSGVAVYLIGLAAFRLRILGQRAYGRLLTAGALIVLYFVSGGIPAWAVGALIAGLIVALCASEVAQGSRRRPEPPGIISMRPR
jgi:hypothetical protein